MDNNLYIRSVSKKNADKFCYEIETFLLNGQKHSRVEIEKIAKKLGITDKTEIKELTELAIFHVAYYFIHSTSTSLKQKFDKIVELYNSQCNLSFRTSQSILLQQYSTPIPIAFIAGLFIRGTMNNPFFYVFESCAGNGLLTIAFLASQCVVNELDELRLRNLNTIGFKKVLKQDATESFPQFKNYFDGVICNPPFGSLDKQDHVDYDGFPIKSLEQLIALRTLDCMKDNGSAAIIIGGHTEWDEMGRIQAGKNRIFFGYLYSHYNVKDVINIDGKLYARMGTQFPIRLILIKGRKSKPEGFAPLYNEKKDYTVKTFDELYQRINNLIKTQTATTEIMDVMKGTKPASSLKKLQHLAVKFIKTT